MGLKYLVKHEKNMTKGITYSNLNIKLMDER